MQCRRLAVLIIRDDTHAACTVGVRRYCLCSLIMSLSSSLYGQIYCRVNPSLVLLLLRRLMWLLCCAVNAGRSGDRVLPSQRHTCRQFSKGQLSIDAFLSVKDRLLPVARRSLFSYQPSKNSCL